VDAHPAAAAPHDRRGRKGSRSTSRSPPAPSAVEAQHVPRRPATFIMISNHFPTATYGNHYAVWILGGLILFGWGAPRCFAAPDRGDA
jgi:hypothetical protein